MGGQGPGPGRHIERKRSCTLRAQRPNYLLPPPSTHLANDVLPGQQLLPQIEVRDVAHCFKCTGHLAARRQDALRRAEGHASVGVTRAGVGVGA